MGLVLLYICISNGDLYYDSTWFTLCEPRPHTYNYGMRVDSYLTPLDAWAAQRETRFRHACVCADAWVYLCTSALYSL